MINMNTNYGDQEMLTDMLSSQKMITGNYNTVANEAASDSIKNQFIGILHEEHKMQHDIFLEMQNRGWYQTNRHSKTR